MGPDQKVSTNLSEGTERIGFLELQGAMREVTRKLEARNPEYGNQLFAIFGRGESRIFVFNTPVTKDISQGGVQGKTDEYLVVTEAGFRLIQIDHGYNREFYERSFKTCLNPRQSNQNLPSPQEAEYKYGYWRDQTGGEWIKLGGDDTSLGSLTIKSKGESFALEAGGPGPETSQVRLVTIPEPTVVTEILELNLDRVRHIPEQRQLERDASIKPHLDAAAKVNELLG